MIVFPVNINAEMVVNNSVYEVSVVPDELVFHTDVATAIVTYGDVPEYEGPYTVEPSAHDAIVLNTNLKLCTDDITVNKIKTSETHNPYGVTFYIAEV